MKLLLDTCVWGGAVEVLRNAGHDVVWAGHWDTDPGDSEILATSHSQQRILITLDKDFAEMAIVHGAPHCGIIRLVDLSAHRQGAAILSIIQIHGADLDRGAIITAEPTRLRIRLEPESP